MDDDQDETVGLTEAVRKKLTESQTKPSASGGGDDATWTHENDDELAGAEVAGRYKLFEKIFDDETYVTFRAEHILMNRRVNLKFLRAHLINDKDALLAFRLLVQEQSAGRQSDPAGSPADFGVAGSSRPYAVYLTTEMNAADESGAVSGDILTLAESIRRAIEEEKRKEGA